MSVPDMARDHTLCQCRTWRSEGVGGYRRLGSPGVRCPSSWAQHTLCQSRSWRTWLHRTREVRPDIAERTERRTGGA
eukprot:3876435-Rhodomonas_salina.2